MDEIKINLDELSEEQIIELAGKLIALAVQRNIADATKIVLMEGEKS